MGTWQSAVNVHCCTAKKDTDGDMPSDDEQTEGEDETSAVCVAHPLSWHGEYPSPAEKLPRSISNATTIPTHMQKIPVS